MIVFRYAEILLSKAEAMIEKNTDLSDATDLIDLILSLIHILILLSLKEHFLA